MTIYIPHQSWNDTEFPCILAIGDSWFWYPKNNVVQALVAHPKLRDECRNVQLLGQNGAKLSDYVFGRYAHDLLFELQPRNFQYYSVVLVSGAGNDAVDYSLALRDDCSAIQAPEDCIDPVGMGNLLADIRRSVTTLFHQLEYACAQSPHQYPIEVFLHGYDYPVPDGRGFGLAGLKITGPWLRPALDRAKVKADPELRKAICKQLISELVDTFTALCQYASPNILPHFIDSRGTLDSGGAYQADWDNELHPTWSGFHKVVDRCWIPAFQQRNLATS